MHFPPRLGLRILGAATSEGSRRVSTRDRLGELDPLGADRSQSQEECEASFGVLNRGLVGPHENSRTLASDAARSAWQKAGCPRLDQLIACTSTPPQWGQGLAAQVALDLGLPALLCVDQGASPVAPILALATAPTLLPEGGHVLIVGSDSLSRLAPGENLLGALQVSDGAAALVVEVAALHEPVASGLLGARVITDSQLQNHWILRRGTAGQALLSRHEEPSLSSPTERGLEALNCLAIEATSGAIEASGIPPIEISEVVVHHPAASLPRLDQAGLLRERTPIRSATAGRGDWGCGTLLAHWADLLKVTDKSLSETTSPSPTRLWLATGPGLSAAAIIWRHS